MSNVSVQQFLDAGLSDWRAMSSSLHARFKTGDFVSGTRFVQAVCAAAEELDHHPDVILTYPQVDVTLTSHDEGSVTDRDLDLAREISAIAAEAQIEADPTQPRELFIALDTADPVSLGRFWAEVLGGEFEGDADGGEVTPSHPGLVSLWFQKTTPHEEPRQRFHLDLWVPHDQLDVLVTRAIDAGGTVTKDDTRPSFVVVADPEGNKVCFCTCLNRHP